TFVAARLSGMGSQPSASLGILLNTRGLMELIVLNVGLDLGVISPKLFTMMVLMALATTLATTPALKVFSPTWLASGRRPVPAPLNLGRVRRPTCGPHRVLWQSPRS